MLMSPKAVTLTFPLPDVKMPNPTCRSAFGACCSPRSIEPPVLVTLTLPPPSAAMVEVNISRSPAAVTFTVAPDGVIETRFW